MPDLPLLEGINLPFKEAIDFFRQKARVPTAHWTDVWRTAHSHSFMVAGAAKDALIEDFQREIRRALEDGTTLADFRKSFDTIVAKHGWSYHGTPAWRSRIIYETNLSTAYSAGRYAQLNDPAVRAVFPYWTYVHGDSVHPRPMHLAWNGLTLRADDPFWDSHYPPNGWRCSCSVSATSARGLSRMGKDGPDTSPPVERVAWRNPHTGEVHLVPKGIDPGFDYNPGKAWADGGEGLRVRSPNLRPVDTENATDVAKPGLGDLPGKSGADPSPPAERVPRRNPRTDDGPRVRSPNRPSADAENVTDVAKPGLGDLLAALGVPKRGAGRGANGPAAKGQ